MRPSFSILFHVPGFMRDRFQDWILLKALHGGLPQRRTGFSSFLQTLTVAKSLSFVRSHGVPSGLSVPVSIENPGLNPIVIACAATRGGE